MLYISGIRGSSTTSPLRPPDPYRVRDREEGVILIRCFLGAKLHRMVITEANLDYFGSITIDADLLDMSGILPGEQVLVADLETGERFETYVLEGDRGSGTICINGAAARLVHPGDRVIVLQFVWVGEDEVPPRPRVVVADDRNLNPRFLDT